MFNEIFIPVKNNEVEGQTEIKERKSEMRSLKSMIEKVKKKVVENVSVIFQESLDKEIEYLGEFGAKLSKSLRISEETHLFCGLLCKTESNKFFDNKNNANLVYRRELESWLENALAYFQINKRPDKEVKSIIKKTATDLKFESSQEEQEGIVREETGENHVFQTVRISHNQDGGKNVIIESVDNYLYLDWNSAESVVKVITENGDELVINDILPPNVGLRPAGLAKREPYYDREDHKSKNHFFRTDLKDYVETDDRFSFVSWKTGNNEERGGMVEYGNLSGKGGLLSLLHESGHGWYKSIEPSDSESARSIFEESLMIIQCVLEVLIELEEKLENGEFSREKYERIRKKIKTDLAKDGIEIDPRNLFYNGQALEPGQMIINRIFKDKEQKSIIIRSAKFIEMIDNYALQERDAWAHAIKTLRFLRRKGIDLEPELKTPEDFKEVVQEALQTYQQSLENEVRVMGTRYRKFTTK